MPAVNASALCLVRQVLSLGPKRGSSLQPACGEARHIRRHARLTLSEASVMCVSVCVCLCVSGGGKGGGAF